MLRNFSQFMFEKRISQTSVYFINSIGFVELPIKNISSCEFCLLVLTQQLKFSIAKTKSMKTMTNVSLFGDTCY